MHTLIVADHAPILVAEVSTLEAALHLAQLLRVASGFRTAVRTPDGIVLGDREVVTDGNVDYLKKDLRDSNGGIRLCLVRR